MNLLRRRWWLIAAVATVVVVGAAVYALRQRHVYESTATVYVRLAPGFVTQAGAGAAASQLGVLTYGSLMNTFVSIAQSRSTLVAAAATLAHPPARLDPYTAVVTVRPKSFVLDISVDGPGRNLVGPIAAGLANKVAKAVTTDYPTVALSSLGQATGSSLIRPRLARDLVYGGVAGVILGFVFAALSLSGSRSALVARRASSR